MNAETGGGPMDVVSGQDVEGLAEVLDAVETALAEILKDPDGRDPAWEAVWIGDELKPLLAGRVAAARADELTKAAAEFVADCDPTDARCLLDCKDTHNWLLERARALRAPVASTGHEGEAG